MDTMRMDSPMRAIVWGGEGRGGGEVGVMR